MSVINKTLSCIFREIKKKKFNLFAITKLLEKFITKIFVLNLKLLNINLNGKIRKMNRVFLISNIIFNLSMKKIKNKK